MARDRRVLDMTFRHKVQGSAKRGSLSLGNFGAALAYQFCLALPTAFMQPEDHLLAEPCIYPPPAHRNGIYLRMAAYQGPACLEQMHAIADKLQSTMPNQSTI